MARPCRIPRFARLYDPDMADFTYPDDFPPDLVELRREFHHIGLDLSRLPPERESERGALRDRQHALAVLLSKHPWWDTCGNRSGAGYVLQQGVAAEAANGDGEGS
jgi:hypothetical protein